METTAETILDGLDDTQRRAASSVEGPVRIIACAGAGKTRTITRRIAYGCAVGAWNPAKALAVTFSVKAAQEMRDRLDALGVGGAMRTATFHAEALRQLRSVWPEICEGPFPQLADASRDLAAVAMFRASGEQPEPRMAADVKAEIDWCKVSLVAPEDYARVCSATHRAPPAQLDVEDFTRVYEQYEQEKTARLQIDFNDILLMASHVIEAFPDVAREIRARIGWLTVDEYQDVSPLQHRLMTSWLGDNRNVCVVGDPAQTIYSFAGATSYYLRGFDREFAPLSADVSLDTDYRSSPTIVARANGILARSPMRGDYLRLRTAREGGARVTSAIYGTDAEEARAVASGIARIVAHGGRAGDCAVLTRLTGQQAQVVRALKEAGLPYQVRRDAGWQQSALAAPDASGTRPGDEEAVRQGRVTVCTIHASKGLEFPHVFLIGLSDGLLPYRPADDGQELEEERRVLYVAVTRAEDTLHLSYARRQDETSGVTRSLSRFLH